MKAPHRNIAPPIEYAQRLPWHQRRRARRIAVTLVLLAIGLCALRWGSDIWERANVWYWQRRCLRGNLGSDDAVYESRSLEAAKALVGDASAVGLYPLPTPALRAPPADWLEFSKRANLFAASTVDAPVFLHRLRSPGGNDRLVYVSLTASEALRIGSGLGPMVAVEFLLRPRVIVPGTPLRLPVEISSQGTVGAGVVSRSSVRVFPGKLDPKNPGRFTVRYEVDGKSAWFEGHLLDNDRVLIKRMDREGE